jgi:putative hemolysin
MPELWAELALILLFIAGSGFFATAEFALVTAERGPIAALADKGDRRAIRVARLQAEPKRLLAAVELGQRLMTILAGVTAGAVFVRALADVLNRVAIPWVHQAAYGIAFITVTLVTVFCTLVLGERVPKLVGLRRPERAALLLALPIDLWSRTVYPVIRWLTGISRGVARLLGAGKVQAGEDTFATGTEVRRLIREGHRRGVFNKTERELLAQVFSFADTQVKRVMTARIDMAAIDQSWSADQVLQYISREGYSRYPVFDGTLDRIVGLLHTKDVIHVLTSNGVIILQDLIRRPMFVPDSGSLGPLLRKMQRRQEHLAIVLDEFGGTAGLITLEDLLEEIVGEIRDEHDRELPDFFPQGPGLAHVAGKMSIDEFNSHFDLHLDDAAAQTVAGFVTRMLGHIPDTGEVLETEQVRFRVLGVTENRIDRLECERLVPHSDGAEAGGRDR